MYLHPSDIEIDELVESMSYVVSNIKMLTEQLHTEQQVLKDLEKRWEAKKRRILKECGERGYLTPQEAAFLLATNSEEYHKILSKLNNEQPREIEYHGKNYRVSYKWYEISNAVFNSE